MSSDNPNAAPPCETIPTQRSSVSAVEPLQSFRSAGGTSRRAAALGTPRPSAPWHDLHHAWNKAAPESGGGGGGVWMANANATAGKGGMRSPQPGRGVQLGRGAIGLPHDLFDRRREKLVAEHDRLPVHEHVPHVTRARRVPHHRHRIAHGGVEVRLVQVEYDQVGALAGRRSEEHTSELQSHSDLVCRLRLEKKNRSSLIAKHTD